MNIKTDIPCR